MLVNPFKTVKNVHTKCSIISQWILKLQKVTDTAHFLADSMTLMGHLLCTKSMKFSVSSKGCVWQHFLKLFASQYITAN